MNIICSIYVIDLECFNMENHPGTAAYVVLGNQIS